MAIMVAPKNRIFSLDSMDLIIDCKILVAEAFVLEILRCWSISSD